jgi:CHASE3 domain sensor protein
MAGEHRAEMRALPPDIDDPERRLTLRQADQARDDFAAIESHLEFIMGQLARLPDRAYVSRLLAMATAGLAALIVAVALILAH